MDDLSKKMKEAAEVIVETLSNSCCEEDKRKGR